MSTSYAPEKTASEALHFVRLLIRDTKHGSMKLEDEEITAFLALHGIAESDDPAENKAACYLAAAKCADTIAAQLADESDITITEVAVVKSTASQQYARLARKLEEEAMLGSEVSFVNPEPYPETFVPGVDPLPELE